MVSTAVATIDNGGISEWEEVQNHGILRLLEMTLPVNVQNEIVDFLGGGRCKTMAFYSSRRVPPFIYFMVSGYLPGLTLSSIYVYVSTLFYIYIYTHTQMHIENERVCHTISRLKHGIRRTPTPFESQKKHMEGGICHVVRRNIFQKFLA